MAPSKTPGQKHAASDKFLKQQVQTQGLGAENAHGHSEPHVPGEAPVASDSGISNVGIDNDSTKFPVPKA
ncbi:hypothetical protein G7054_g1455 [Neopestalotiopsis clavispora]|nr:hypothetical protein G7054_g1455 [Neopestalotiopsis clavispora]